jgi:hypothetical protein
LKGRYVDSQRHLSITTLYWDKPLELVPSEWMIFKRACQRRTDIDQTHWHVVEGPRALRESCPWLGVSEVTRTGKFEGQCGVLATFNTGQTIPSSSQLKFTSVTSSRMAKESQTDCLHEPSDQLDETWGCKRRTIKDTFQNACLFELCFEHVLLLSCGYFVEELSEGEYSQLMAGDCRSWSSSWLLNASQLAKQSDPFDSSSRRAPRHGRA